MASDVEARVWAEIVALLLVRLTGGVADAYLELRPAEQAVEEYQLDLLDQRIADLNGPMTETVGQYLRAGLPPAAVKAAADDIERELVACGAPRTTVTAWQAGSHTEANRAGDLRGLAQVAEGRQADPTLHLMAEVLRLFDVRE